MIWGKRLIQWRIRFLWKSEYWAKITFFISAFLSLRGGNSSYQRGNPSCLEDADELSLRLSAHSGSPRATPSRWQGVNGMVVYGTLTTRTHMSLRGENEVKDVAIHCMQWTCSVRTERAVRLLVHSGSPRAFSPRDDKEWGIEVSDLIYNTPCHCEKGTKWLTRQSTESNGRVQTMDSLSRSSVNLYILYPQGHGYFL